MIEQHIISAIMQLNNECYGLQIKHKIEANIGQRIAIAKLYTALDILVKRKIVSTWESQGSPERGGRKKKYFKVNPHLLA